MSVFLGLQLQEATPPPPNLGAAQDGRRWHPPEGDTCGPSDSTQWSRVAVTPDGASVPGCPEEQSQNGKGRHLSPGTSASPRQGTGKGPLTP